MKGKVAGRTLSGAGGVSRLIRVTQPPGDGLQSSFFFFFFGGGGAAELTRCTYCTQRLLPPLLGWNNNEKA